MLILAYFSDLGIAFRDSDEKPLFVRKNL